MKYNDLFGTAALSDFQGRLLAYGNMLGLMDRRQQALPNGALVDPDSRWTNTDARPQYQGLALVPAPGAAQQYYAFYWTQGAAEASQQAFALTYALIDGRLNGGYGDVARKGLVLGLTHSPRLTVVRHANNRDFWVITRDEDGRGFQAFLLTPQGIRPTPVVSLAGQALPPTTAELKAAPNGRQVACGARTQSTAQPFAVCVYDFDNATGEVSHERVIHRNAEVTFSISFSPNSQLLYTTEYPTRPLPPRRFEELWQFNLALPTEAAVDASRYWVSQAAPTPTEPDDDVECGGLQLAPDGTLWASRFYLRIPINRITGALRSNHAAVVRHPDIVGAGCGFEPEGYAYRPGAVPSITLPNVITNMLYAPAALNYEAICPDDSVQFWASSAGDPVGLRWDFGEPAGGAANAATGPFVAHRYQQGGTYAVRLTLADGRVLTRAVTVSGTTADFTDQNVFTPNGDGLNDEFRPVRAPVPGGRLRVFSRWGRLVFQATDPALRWDGTGAAGGDYFYLLDYADCRGTARHRRGTLTLVR
ncbi:T9SS type B sorting domain-containing protein [Hymenobacter rubidus]|uniref:T9SS type B sorting domain-containing protein n=1 Tax=Hymenobacter rubidus TaxID=1441626 RepID=UPI00191DB521|nr:gliding motility-associated C-terminal domain-containing protein [Hymenobacter rubidus]